MQMKNQRFLYPESAAERRQAEDDPLVRDGDDDDDDDQGDDDDDKGDGDEDGDGDDYLGHDHDAKRRKAYILKMTRSALSLLGFDSKCPMQHFSPGEGHTYNDFLGAGCLRNTRIDVRHLLLNIIIRTAS